MRRWHAVLAAAVVSLQGCGGEAGEAAGAAGEGAASSLWSLSPAPVVEIGVVEGETGYQLHQVRGASRLGDGRIVVLDGGSQELRFFSAEGRLLSVSGGRGDGPGEFRFPWHLWRGVGDTLRVLDAGHDRFSFFAPDGSFLRTEPASLPAPSPTAPADPFRMDVWVHGWNWIDSPLSPEERGGLAAALERLPPPDTAAGVRYVRLTEDGLLWTTSPVPPADRSSSWQVHGPDGRLHGRFEVPARFEPFDIGDDYVLGRHSDEMGVAFVRLYALDRAGEAGVAPGLAAYRGRGPATYPSLPDEAYQDVREALMAVASHQEIYYSSHMSYSSDFDALEIPADRLPSGVHVQVMMADDRGWAGVFLHRASGSGCALGYGASMPPGWAGGTMTCPGREG